jgi:anti-sigma regulatory factor (Ser/Thr protein kinase)
MNIQLPYKVELSFPGDIEYIPAIRKFISEILLVSHFSPKFAYRSEIIVDEICNNAVNYGCKTEDARIDLICNIYEDGIDFTVKDPGGDNFHVERLKNALSVESDKKSDKGLGLEIVRMLSESLNVVIDEQNLTSVRVVRKRENFSQNN